MFKKILLLSYIFIFSVSICGAMNPQHQLVLMPDAQTLCKLFENRSLATFMTDTSIIEKLAGKELEAIQIAGRINDCCTEYAVKNSIQTRAGMVNCYNEVVNAANGVYRYFTQLSGSGR